MSDRSAKKFSRQELYDLVWAKPVTQVADEVGLSNVGLAKLCRRYQIPLPYRGYWARKAAGQTPRPLTLPARREEAQEDIWVFATPLPAIAPPDPDVEHATAQDANHGPDLVPADLRSAHVLVRQCQEALKDAGPDNYGRVGPRWNRHSPIALNVGPKSVNRVLRISQAIIRGAITRGYKLDTSDPRDTVRIVVRRGGFRFSFEEPSKLRRDQPERRGYDYRRYEPAGRLKLHLSAYGDNVRTMWEDTETDRVEDCLADFFRSLAAAAVHAERREQQRQREEEERHALERLREEYREAKRQLDGLVASRAQADALREFLASLDAAGVDMSRPVGRHDSWRAWVLDVIQGADPLIALRAGKIRLGRHASAPDTET